MSAEAAPWWSLLAPVELRVECVGREHTVRWAGGQLTAVDHPDADRERALVALGAESHPCLELTGAWERHADDLDLLVLAARRPGEPLAGAARVHDFGWAGGRGGHGWHGGGFVAGRFAPMSAVRRGSAGVLYGHRDDEDGPDDLTRLLGAGGGLGDRLVATVVASWTDRVARDDPRVASRRPALRAALYGRALEVVRAWVGNPQQRVEVVLVGPAQPATARAVGDGIRLELPFSWLRDVWAPGLAVSFGQLVLAAQPKDDGWVLDGIDHEWTPRSVRVSW